MAYNDDYLDEIHEAASQKNYKALLQNDIARYNLKLGEQKYLENSLASQGLASQGYGSTAHIGVENQAANLYAQNQENYNQTEQDLLLQAQERQKAAANESDNQLATFLQYSDGSDEAISRYMGNYGYTKNEEGKWVDKDGKEASPYILSSVQSAGEQVASGTKTPAKFIEGAIASNARTKGADVETWIENNNDDTARVWSYVKPRLQPYVDAGQIRNGTVVNISAVGTPLMFKDGKWYPISKEYYDLAPDKLEVNF